MQTNMDVDALIVDGAVAVVELVQMQWIAVADKIRKNIEMYGKNYRERVVLG